VLSFNRFLIPALIAAPLSVAACGGGSHTSSSTTENASARAPASGSAGSRSGATIGTATGAMGAYLTGASGRALYLWVADSQGGSACSGACAQAWPPLTASATPHATGGVNAADLSLISRPDGTKQVAYNGHPLYYFAGDTGAGMTTGQGSNGFGAKWWLVAPSGSAITTSSSSGGGAPSGSSGGNSSGGYSSSESQSEGGSSGGGLGY
jgi:predicted lipoprotein with Yx(FWY)xxD motif